jgi:hypothetical protein
MRAVYVTAIGFNSGKYTRVGNKACVIPVRLLLQQITGPAVDADAGRISVYLTRVLRQWISIISPFTLRILRLRCLLEAFKAPNYAQ